MKLFLLLTTLPFPSYRPVVSTLSVGPHAYNHVVLSAPQMATAIQSAA